VDNDPDESAISLEKWAYELRPASHSAIYIAQLYAGEFLRHQDLTKQQIADFNKLAIEYLDKADAQIQREATITPNYTDTDRYLFYRTWKAITYGYLSMTQGEPYKSQYRKEYEDFFTYAATQKSSHAKDEVFFARYQYSRALAGESDWDTEKVQLDLAAK